MKGPLRAVSCLGVVTAIAATAACGSAPTPAASAPAAPVPITLAILPAESDAFPRTAEALTDSLRKASVSGIDRTQLSQVSLEVVQLSIECVEPTTACYAAVGKSLEANRLLFAELSGSKQRVKVTITLFDVDTQSPKSAEKVYASEREATAGIADLIAEATR